jgi:hypothetical protein
MRFAVYAEKKTLYFPFLQTAPGILSPTVAVVAAGCRAAVAAAWSRRAEAWNRMTAAEFGSRIRHIRGSSRYP